MNKNLILKNRLKEVRAEKKLSKADLAAMVGVSRNTISYIETEKYYTTDKLALIISIDTEINIEENFFFE